ncbi:hypothetical protein ABMA28_000203 [Loxostege sticticalis]|uniref:Uncharacterized protein n=1 Tax=Loxostege sticticalis TaxID=481309 RepID=A0ABD0TRT2_LOXSC
MFLGRITAEVSRHVTAASSGKAQSDRSRVERPTRADAAVDSTACRPPTLINITVPHMQAFIETLCVANRLCEICSQFENINASVSVSGWEVGSGARASSPDATVITQ